MIQERMKGLCSNYLLWEHRRRSCDMQKGAHIMYFIPDPQQCIIEEGSYRITYDRKIVIDSSCGENAWEYALLLRKEFEASLGYAPAVTRGNSRKTGILLAEDGGLKPEEYTLEINREGIRIVGGPGGGLLYAVQTLRQIVIQEGACVPLLKIRDYPELPNRGFYRDVTRGRIPTLDSLKKLVDKMAFYKLNQLQLYVEHSFLFEGLSEVWRDDTPLTPEDILELDRYCRLRNIELVPSIASFGHMYKILRTKSFQELCELPNPRSVPFGFVDRMEHHTVDASNHRSIEFVKKLIEAYLPLFTSSHFNICADETFDLGKGKSRELADRIGVHKVYLDYVKELCGFLVEKGKTPMFWGDVICEFPEAVKELPPETICLNWGYDRSQKEDAVRALKAAGAAQYCCPGVQGWNRFVNDLDAAYENIKRMCSYAVKYAAQGVLNTDWGDYGHINQPEFGVTGMIYGAAFSWNSRISEKDEINRRISRIEFGDHTESIVSLLAQISGNCRFSWWDAIYFMEGKAQAPKRESLFGIKEAMEGLENIQARLYAHLRELEPLKRKEIKPYFIAIQGMTLLQRLGVVLEAKEHGTEPLEEINALELACRLEEWFYDYKELWRIGSRESELYRIQNVINWYADYLRAGRGEC